MKKMKRLYEENRLAFSLIWIGLYVVLLSFADGISESLGVEKAVTAPLCIVMSVFLWVWLKKNDWLEECGLCAFRGNAGKYLYFIPLAAIVSANLWFGVHIQTGITEMLLYIVSMLCVGFLEEVIFRGFLFRSLLKNGETSAILISALTFGIGHIVNLLNGADLLPTLLQIVYASAAGLLFTLLFHRSGSLVPCIAAHSVLNALSIFKAQAGRGENMITAAALTVIALLYSIWIWKKTA